LGEFTQQGGVTADIHYGVFVRGVMREAC
jgi:hypothetical protein